jgi:hypothetical protein
MDIEKIIRLEIGDKIMRDEGLPVHIRGKAKYDGPLSICVYRKYFPKANNCFTAYLTLKRISGTINLSREFAEVIGEYFLLEEKKQYAIAKSNYDEAGVLRDDQKKVLSSCSKLLEEK